MNSNEKVYYVYFENGKAVIAEEKPDFSNIHDYIAITEGGMDFYIGVHKNQKDASLPDEPIDAASMLINAEVSVDLGDKEPLTCPKYDPNQLREIAEHLLVYCKAQERGCADACCENCEP